MKSSCAQISGGQLTLLLITLVGATALLYAPTMSIITVKQDAWFPLLVLATLYGLTVVLITTKLALRFEGMTFGQYTKDILGGLPSRIMGFLYLAFILTLLLVIVREFGGFLSAAFMPETPLVVFILPLLVFAAFSAIGGVEVIARMNQFLLPLAIFGLTFTFIFILKDMELLNLLPVLDHDPITLLKASIVPSLFRGEVFVLMWLVYNLKKPKESTRKGAWAVIFLAITLALDAILVITVMGQELATKMTFPTLSLIRYARVGFYLSRIEGLVMALWVAGVMVKVSLFLFVALVTAKETLSWEKSPWFLMLFMIVFLTLTSIYAIQNDAQLTWLLEKVLPPLALTFQLIIPTILLLIALIRKKGVKI